VRCVREVGQNAGHTSDKNILNSQMCLDSAQDIEEIVLFHFVYAVLLSFCPHVSLLHVWPGCWQGCGNCYGEADICAYTLWKAASSCPPNT